METLNFSVQLEGCGAVFITSDLANTVEKAVEVAREKLKAPDAKHVHTDIFKGQSLWKTERGVETNG